MYHGVWFYETGEENMLAFDFQWGDDGTVRKLTRAKDDYYPLSILQRQWPEHLNSKEVHLALSDEEFFKAFKMTKTEFCKQNPWQKCVFLVYVPSWGGQ